MESLQIRAYAKINLALDVIRRREDGYHEVDMVMQQIDIYDNITLSQNDDGVIITCNNPKIPTDSSNLVYKAWKVISDFCNIKRGIHINIEKNIPSAAGLAGGSSDAAAVLKGLNKLWNLNLDMDQLMMLGTKIGADVPYCILGGTARARGIGEKLTKLKSCKDKLVLIAKPDIDVSTAYVYNNLKLSDISIKHPDIELIEKCIQLDDLKTLSEKMGNVLESVTANKYDIIQTIKQVMMNNGAIGSLMSGSGPTVFGVYENQEDLKKSYENLKCVVPYVSMTKTI